ncbi:Acetyltransferase (GNAT) domain-containing protein [Oceanobacillus limi]|uniref:Acetyltransferase (GNAT) domain-containing protein n=1 Tax=Oceanobacillus limi TaxID=930131 RepID=A0A1I0CGW7_9BACI|nr:GNAT family N-acetyltransferase [Oceanobacillus limi]SET18843.1 Acetyltransferase (GNAT) domain-containing protein [Oceanobacillus limi]
MEKLIRVLHNDDYPSLEKMETGNEDDYVKRVFQRLSSGQNRLYGLFVDGQLASLGGISIYAKHYVMLGRLRSDIRFRGNDFATEIMAYMMNESFQMEGIHWIGANTQEENLPARRVMKKIGLEPYTMIHGAITKDTSMLETGEKPWKTIHDIERKKALLRENYIDAASIFPYECYYPFPASDALFPDEKLQEWSFYENDNKTRFVITKKDQKKHHYLHAIYPWDDITEQNGLWETISLDYQELSKQNEEEETYIWMDLTKEEAKKLPANHSFTIPSPWILHGITKEQWQTKIGARHLSTMTKGGFLDG